jgi:hypothetical protein
LHLADKEVAMQGRKTALIVRMNEAQRAELRSCLRAQKTPVGLAKRSWATLLLAGGQSYTATARQVGLALTRGPFYRGFLHQSG